MASRLRLRPDLRPLRRGRGAVQLGLRAASGGIIVAGLAPAEIDLIERLDGSLRPRDLYAAAAAAGVDPDRAVELLDLLLAHDVLVDADDRREVEPGDPEPPDGPYGPDCGLVPDGGLVQDSAALRGHRSGTRVRPRVVVDGTGPLPAAVAALMRASGAGRVDAGPWAADVADAELREQLPRDGPGEPVVLVVLMSPGGIDPRAGESWRVRGIPVLPVVGDGGRVVVGPLVAADPALPCLRCLQLTRVDRDAAWPELMAQATVRGADRSRDGPSARGARPGVGHGSGRADVVAVAAGVVAMVVHAALQGPMSAGVPAGVSVEVGAPWPRLDHRRWTRHPACSTHTVGEVTGPVPRPGTDPRPARVTMTR